VLPDRSGLLVHPGDAKALARALETLLTASDEVRRCMGEAGRAHVRANFSLERMCRDTLDLYRRLLSHGGNVW
jgi:glycosyltransferase involved in cell wall biosynthesis